MMHAVSHGGSRSSGQATGGVSGQRNCEKRSRDSLTSMCACSGSSQTKGGGDNTRR